MNDSFFQVLLDWGLVMETAIPPHTWRCAYYKDLEEASGGGPCNCIDELIEDLEEAAKNE